MGNTMRKPQEPEVTFEQVPLAGNLHSKKNLSSGSVACTFDPSLHVSAMQNNLRFQVEMEHFVDFTVDNGPDSSLRFHSLALAAISPRIRDLMQKSITNQEYECQWEDIDKDTVAELHDLVYGVIAWDDVSSQTRAQSGLPARFNAESLLESFFSLYKAKELMNISLTVDDEQIFCHREVLAACSPRLFHVLSELDESGDELDNFADLRLHGIDIDILYNIIDYMYTAKVTIDTHNCQHLLHAAVEYQLPNVVKVCLDFIMDSIIPANAVGMRFVAEGLIEQSSTYISDAPNGVSTNAWKKCLEIVKIHLKDFLEETKNFILNNFMAVSREDEILGLSCEELDEYVSNDVDLEVESECDLFWLVMAWYDGDREKRGVSVGALMDKVIFDDITTEEKTDILKIVGLVEWPAHINDIIREKLQINGKTDGFESNPSVLSQFPEYEDIDHDMGEETYTVPCGPKGHDFADIPGRLTKKGLPDFRDRVNRRAFLQYGTNKDGTKDMRCEINKSEGNVSRSGDSMHRKLVPGEGQAASGKKSCVTVFLNKSLIQIPLKKDGTPDRRYKVTRCHAPLKKDGTPDMRFKANKLIFGPQSTSSPQQTTNSSPDRHAPLIGTKQIDDKDMFQSPVPLKKDGTPDRRFKVNRQLIFDDQNTRSPALHLKADGTPDMRFKENRTLFVGEKSGGAGAHVSVFSSSQIDAFPGPRTKSGNPDMRYKENRDAFAPSCVTTPVGISPFHGSGPLKKDGTPDMRYKENRDAFAPSCVSTLVSISPFHGSGPLKKDGTPDMRYKANREAAVSSSIVGSSYPSTSYGIGPTKKDGTPDMRYKVNKETYGQSYSSNSYYSPSYSSSSVCSGPLKKDGTPDMRFKANRRR